MLFHESMYYVSDTIKAKLVYFFLECPMNVKRAIPITGMASRSHCITLKGIREMEVKVLSNENMRLRRLNVAINNMKLTCAKIYT